MSSNPSVYVVLRVWRESRSIEKVFETREKAEEFLRGKGEVSWEDGDGCIIVREKCSVGPDDPYYFEGTVDMLYLIEAHPLE